MADDVDRDAERSKLECTKKKLCFIHFKDVSQSLTPISGTGLRMFVTCSKRWAALDWEKAGLCLQSYKVFAEEEYCKYFIMLMNDVTNESVTKISFRKSKKNSARIKT